MKKINLYSTILIVFTILSLLFIKLFHKQIDIILANSINFGNLLLIFFVAAFVIVGIIESDIIKKPKSAFTIHGLLILSISTLLVLSIFNRWVGIYATAFFIICTLIYFIKNGKVYAINPVFLLVFAYAILEFIGTIGTKIGFRFPEMTYSFYLIPIAFSCFRIEKETLLRILRFLFRVILVFMSFSIINWFFNIIHFQVGIVEWITKKTNVNGMAAYEYVCSWSHYKHPSYINLVLIPTLFSGFYIHHKKQEKSYISQLELAVFVVFCLFLELLMESRIGLVGVVFVLVINTLYYLHIKKIYFKIVLIAFLVIGGAGLVVMEHSVSSFISDPVRKTDSALAIHYIKDHLWWGAGYDEEYIVLKQQEMEMSGVLPKLNQPKTYVHNSLLGNMVQYGIPGAVILVVMMVGLFWYSLQSRNYLLQMFVCLYLLFMMIEEPLYVQEGITRFMVFLTFFIHIIDNERKVKCYTLFKWPPKG